MHDDPERFRKDWDRLSGQIRLYGSDLVLLPEMPFSPWFAWQKKFEERSWREAVESHDRWMPRCQDLAPAVVLGTRPCDRKDGRFNEGFVWKPESGYVPAHTKHYLPKEEGYWEEEWYQPGEKSFVPVNASQAKVGFTICTELWFLRHSREYGKEGTHIVACPRATPSSTLDKWLAGGQVSAVVSGAFSLSSNKVSERSHPSEMGGQGWIIGPDGDVLAVTSEHKPFITMEIDLSEAERAKTTYPRYVRD
jgi:N-carbamoylputrescine amidase